MKKRPNEKFNRKAKNGKDSKKKLKKIKKTGAPLSTGRMWVTEQLEASRLKQEEETENETKSSNQKSEKRDEVKENYVNLNLLYNYPLLPKDE